ncbi:AAEL004906-PA, partial [Aedes aegypti]
SNPLGYAVNATHCSRSRSHQQRATARRRKVKDNARQTLNDRQVDASLEILQPRGALPHAGFLLGK